MSLRLPVNPIKAPPGSTPQLVEVVRQLNQELAKIRAEIPLRIGDHKTDGSGLAVSTTDYVEVVQNNTVFKLGVVA